MIINGYGVSYNYSSYNSSANKAKTSSASIPIPTEKSKTESKNNNATNNSFKDTAKTSSISLSSEIYSKTERTRSDEEILKDIVEVAKKHAEQGTYHNRDDEYSSLMREYISSASPDRESILENTVNEVNEKIKTSNSKKDGEEKENFDPIGTLLQVLKNMEKGGSKIKSDSNETTSNSNEAVIYNMSGTMYDAYVEDGEMKDALMYDSNGAIIMRYNSGQVTEYWTNEENARSNEIIEAYNEAYKSTSNSKGFVSGNAFDAVG